MKWWMKIQNFLGIRKWSEYENPFLSATVIENKKVFKLSVFYCKKTNKFFVEMHPYEFSSKQAVHHFQKLSVLDEKSLTEKHLFLKKKNIEYVKKVNELQKEIC